MKHVFRPSHADLTYQKKYGIRDYRGGGRASARETLARVAGGAIAKQILAKYQVEIQAFVGQVGHLSLADYTSIDYSGIQENAVRCPDPELATMMEKEIEKAKELGDSLGGVIGCHVLHCPVGLGEPVFDKLEADLAKAMLSIPAARGFDIGAGFASASMYGSAHNDAFDVEGEKIVTKTNHSGGVQGGISNGETIHFKVAFKPVSTIALAQDTIDIKGKKVILEAKGRHDPCVLPRAVPIVEAMAALVVCDHLLRYRCLADFVQGT
jgi:chorismate synthase